MIMTTAMMIAVHSLFLMGRFNTGVCAGGGGVSKRHYKTHNRRKEKEVSDGIITVPIQIKLVSESPLRSCCHI